MQNLNNITFTTTQLEAIDLAVQQLEQQLASLITLSTTDKLRIAKLGDKSEAFCRQSLRMLADNPQVIPPHLDVAGAQRDLDARDQLRPRLMRLECLLQRGYDTSIALGGEAMAVATQGYSLLKVLGRSAGLDPLRKELGNRWVRSPRAAAEKKVA
jgi:hypothetical protein